MQSGSSHASAPLGFLPLHIPGLQIESWIQKCIKSLEDLYDGSSIRPYSVLQDNFRLPEMDHFKYLQITHLLIQVSSKQRTIPSPVLSLLSTLTYQKSKGSRVFYNLFTSNDIFCKTTNILKWETELGKQFAPTQWKSAIKWAHRSSSCANHREQFHKLLTRWYFTPLRLAKAYSTASPHCWRSCGSVGSLLHIFCPFLS